MLHMNKHFFQNILMQNIENHMHVNLGLESVNRWRSKPMTEDVFIEEMKSCFLPALPGA